MNDEPAGQTLRPASADVTRPEGLVQERVTPRKSSLGEVPLASRTTSSVPTKRVSPASALKEATKKLVCLFLALRVAVVGFTSITAPSEDRGSEARGAATALLAGIAIAATRSVTAERAVNTRVVMATQYGPGGG